ncbi:gallate dioxygenase [Pseudorhodoplanes sinuspersici]|uniref:Protocatechuate 3,4-dioxygenase n=1 Tax=Pseudorhodoplanes sinuspersici TaxID=1235591 RepID=A0A1W6ZVP3_9HYPH|nr:gallate dioxygenase [Pseudorhodoplanes sinuspersici]ARQ01467.1 protocatechuate 3,4-dioxygenase [Pseudorhodoplanes sinuspersici]RKE73160.1 protocatechuate 4,5-dioxygenase alpha subunit /protocatechuate 4,5-dioxygenase beta subunit [Pseudorhodoplanes sinuspersici]
MARIVGAIATSHTPTIGFAYDRNKQDDPVWAPIFEAYKPIQRWIAEKKPDVLFIIYNDHVTSFFFDHYSAFTLGIDDSYAVADEGGGARALPPVKGHAPLSHHIGMALMADEFDMSFFQDRALDHGCFSPLSMMCPHTPQWPVSIVPLQVGVLQFPIPSALRCWKLGQSLRRAIESYPEDISVAIVATGGLSHQVHGERCGFNNTAWDAQFLDLIERDPVKLTELTHADYARLGGIEGAEVIMWLVMRGALSANIRKIHQTYYLPSVTGIATAIYENEAIESMADTDARYLDHIGRQLQGVEQLPGTYPFTHARSLKGYRLNKFLHRLVEPAHRAHFLAEPEAAFSEAKLSEEERGMVRRRDWRAMIQYGVSFFMLEKLAAVTGSSNLHIYAGMRGQTLEDFMKTRNAPGALYSVAGKDAKQFAWDKEKAPA